MTDDDYMAALVADEPAGLGTPEARLAAEVDRLRLRRAAAEIVAAEQAAALPLPAPVRLDQFLARPDPETCYRVDDLLTIGGRVLFTAAAKGGKTTMRDELVRSLADGVPFLGQFPVVPADKIVLIDNELDERTLRRWLRAHGIINADRVTVVPLRGHTATFDITIDANRARWAEHIGPADVVIIDCLRPILDAIGLDENRDAGRFLVALDALLAEARIGECVVIHHMGHGAERSRGDSRLRDWPDAEWRIVRDRTDDPNDVNPTARRYFSAYGRDVDVREGLLEYDPDTRTLTLAGGSRSDTHADAAVADLLDLLNEHPEGLTGRKIEAELTDTTSHPQRVIRDAIRRARNADYTITLDGPRRARIHHITPTGASVRRSASPMRQRTQSECVSASIGDALTHSTDNPPPSASPDALTAEDHQ